MRILCIRAFFLGLLVLGWSCYGEAENTAAPTGNSAAPAGAPVIIGVPVGPRKPVGANPNFDDNFFAPKVETVGPKSGGRYYGEEPDYTTVQKKEWEEFCAPKRRASMEAFRECYFEQKRLTQQGLQRNRQEVEGRFKGAGMPDGRQPSSPAERALK